MYLKLSRPSGFHPDCVEEGQAQSLQELLQALYGPWFDLMIKAGGRILKDKNDKNDKDEQCLVVIIDDTQIDIIQQPERALINKEKDDFIANKRQEFNVEFKLWLITEFIGWAARCVSAPPARAEQYKTQALDQDGIIRAELEIKIRDELQEERSPLPLYDLSLNRLVDLFFEARLPLSDLPEDVLGREVRRALQLRGLELQVRELIRTVKRVKAVIDQSDRRQLLDVFNFISKASLTVVVLGLFFWTSPLYSFFMAHLSLQCAAILFTLLFLGRIYYVEVIQNNDFKSISAELGRVLKSCDPSNISVAGTGLRYDAVYSGNIDASSVCPANIDVSDVSDENARLIPLGLR